MKLDNYLLELIWLFFFGAISFLFTNKQDEIVLGKKEERWHWLPALILIIPFIFWAAWRPNNFGDTGAYRLGFKSLPSSLSSIGEVLSNQQKDVGFTLLQIIFKSLISRSDILFFMFIAAIQLLCLTLIYRKYSCNYWMSIFFFVASTDYLSWIHNGMRQFIAVAIIFACFPLLLKKKYTLLAIIVVVLSRIHLSCLIFLPFIFIVNGRAWNGRTLLFILLIILSVLFVDRITGIITNAIQDTAYSGEVIYFTEADDGTNIYRVVFYSIPAVMAFVFRQYIDEANDPLINICVNLSVVAAGFYVFSFFTSGILIGRIPIYFSLSNYILVPWLIKNVFNSESRAVLNIGFAGVYIVFFLIQLTTWGLI